MNPSRFPPPTRIFTLSTRRRLHTVARIPTAQLRSLSTPPIPRPNTPRPPLRSSAKCPLAPSPISIRLFSHTHTAQNQKQQTTFTDPARPDLFYHLVPPPNPLSSVRPAFAVSLLESPPPSSLSSTVLGWLPADVQGQEEDAGLNDFKENHGFRELLHKAISSGLSEDMDEIQIAGAIQTGQGWMHINDARNVPALGRIGDPDDIIGSVRVEDGKILAETYEPMPSYRLCTADGVTKLTDGLATKLRAVLGERAREEAQA